MTSPAPRAPWSAHLAERTLRRNLTAGILGVAARASQLLVLLVMNRLFGAATAGLFLVGFGLFEIASSVVATGFTDGAMLLVSRGSGAADGAPSDTRPLARVIATGVWLGGAAAVLLAAAITGLGAALAPHLPGSYQAVMPAIAWLAWALPPLVVARVCFAATTGFLRPEWEALAGGAAPAVVILTGLPIAHALGAGVRGLFATVLVAQLINAGIAVVAVSGWLGARPLWQALCRPWREGFASLDRALVRFAVPQSLNMAANTYLARVDVLLLAAAGMPAAAIGVYGSAAAIVLELRQIRTLVSGALAPIVARHHAAGDRPAIAHALSRSAGWVARLAVPAALLFLIFRGNILRAIAPGYTGSAAFLPVLVLGPVVNCLGGLSGNFLIYLLRNRWNLANALAVAVLATVLGGPAVRAFGLTGAALISAGAMASVTLLENVELALLERVRIAGRALFPALATFAAGAAAILALGGR
jgi:O-antigen/teichoic acid export membrane protein